MLKSVRQYSLYLAWLIALIALLISLFSSEVLNMAVCHLCWYQRVCIYPLAIILGIAAYQNDFKIVKYTLPLAIIGLLFAIYQYLEQMVSGFSPINFCCLKGPDCSDIHFKYWGFITFPFLSILATLAISVLLIIIQCCKPKSSPKEHYK